MLLAPALILGLAAGAQQGPAASPAAAPATAPVPAPSLPVAKPPTTNLKLVRVGGALDGRVIQFFDEGSIVRDGTKAMVWRLYVLGSPRPIGRRMSQAIWTLSEFDCEAQVVTDRQATLLGMGLEPTGRTQANVGATLYAGALADATTGREACGGEGPDGPRYDSVSMAVRKARQGKE